MHPYLAVTLDSLDLPALSEADLTALKALQSEWERHSERMLLLQPERVLKDRKAARDAFLADPNEENEDRLIVLADERLTGRRHAFLHEAYAELKRRSCEKAAGILRPVLESLQQVLKDELGARETAVQAQELNKRTDDRCIELRKAQDRITHALKVRAEAINIAPIEELSPMGLAEVLLADGAGPQAA